MRPRSGCCGKRGCMNKILWDENGQIACEQHAPFRGSDTWRSGRWRAITRAEAEAVECEVGRAPECETCASIARRAEEKARAALDPILAEHAAEYDAKVFSIDRDTLAFSTSGEIRMTGTAVELFPRVQAYFTEPV